MRIERFVSKDSELQGSGLVKVRKGKATLNPEPVNAYAIFLEGLTILS
jgi:hypothetical protein